MFPSFPLTDQASPSIWFQRLLCFSPALTDFLIRCSLLFGLTTLFLPTVWFVSLPKWKWVTIITLITQMGWGRKRQEAAERGADTTAVHQQWYRHSPATSQHQLLHCSCKLPCTTHSPLIAGSCLTFPSSEASVLPSVSWQQSLSHARMSHTTCVQGEHFAWLLLADTSPALDSISQVRREGEWEVCLICSYTTAQPWM